MNTKQQKKPQRKQRSQNVEETIVARARRMARSQLRKVAAAIGMEGEFSEEAFNAKITELAKAQEEKQSVVERIEGRANTYEEENKELRQRIAELQVEKAAATRKAEAHERELFNHQLESEIKEDAIAAGVADVEYGIELFKRYARDLPEDQEGEIDVKKFFEELKKDPKKRALFQPEEVTAHPPSAADRAAANQQPGHQGATQGQTSQAAPKPAGGQNGVEEVDAVKMSPQQFADHAMAKYGYRPGQA